MIRLIIENTISAVARESSDNRRISGFVAMQDAAMPRNLPTDLLAFFADRLKVQLREQGARHDLVDAVFALGGQDDLLMIVRRVEALGKFLDTDDGKNLLAGTKRASNILAIEEKKDKRSFDGAPDAALYKLDEEKALAKAIDQVKAEAGAAVAKEDFAGAMSAMAKLRPAVDAFFDKVKVNDDDAEGAREPPEAAQRNPRRDARGRGFLEDPGLARSCPRTKRAAAVMPGRCEHEPGSAGCARFPCAHRRQSPARWGKTGRGCCPASCVVHALTVRPDPFDQ